MLATFGFGITGILFFLFALDIEALPFNKFMQTLRVYAQAYFLVAYAFILWSFASYINSSRFLAFSVVVGDILLAAATLLMLNILLGNKPNKKVLIYSAISVAVILLFVRVVYFYPTPYMIDQVLFFNSQRLVSFTIASAFLFIWFPVNLHMSDIVSQKVPSMRRLYTFLYTAATLSAVIFLLSKAPLTLVLSFTAISISFLMLIISSRYIRILEKHTHVSK
jgi:hypothetical protein